MVNSNFISFPVSYSYFAKIKQHPYDKGTKIIEAINQIYKMRNFNQTDLNHPFIQIESRLFILFSLFLKKITPETAYDFLKTQFALLFLMESIFYEIRDLQAEASKKLKQILKKGTSDDLTRFFEENYPLKKVEKFFEELIKIIFIEKINIVQFEINDSNDNDNNNNQKKILLFSKVIKDSLKELLPNKDFSQTVEIFFAILYDDIKENIFNFKVFRDWNRDEFPLHYQPLIQQIAALLSNIAIHKHQDKLTELFAEQTCLSLKPTSWFKEKVITESKFLAEEAIIKQPNKIELDELSDDESSLLSKVV